MRIPIGVQLGLLVTFFSLLALGVSSLAVWFTNRGFVLKFRSQRLSLTASLKAAQLASDLQLMQSKVQGLTSRIRFQQALERYNSGERNPDIWDVPQFDLQSAISTGQGGVHTVQVGVYPTNDTGTTRSVNLFNVTATDYQPIELPYKYPNGTQAYFGWGELGHPSLLYPNFTYTNGATFYEGRRLSATSSLLLGPLQTNQSFSLVSITSPVLSLGQPDLVLAWITVVTDFSLIRGVQDSPVGLDETGLTVIVGPADPSNRLPPGLAYSDHESEEPEQSIDGTQVHFVLPPNRSNTTTQRHGDLGTGTFDLTSYPAAATGLTRNLHELNNAGANLEARNEAGVEVSVGWATPQTDLCDWVIIVEQTREKIFVSIDNLKKVLLGCVFGSLAFIILVTIPTSWSTTRAIRQLRDSTQKSIERAHSVSVDGFRSFSNAKLASMDGNIDEKNDGNLRDKRRKWFPDFGSVRRMFRPRQHEPPVALEHGKRSYIPEKVQEGKHWIKDEITDLTSFYNVMTDRIEVHASELEDRVRERTVQLEASTRAAESANESKTLFIANISHELKTPLNGILGMCALTLQETDLKNIRHSMNIALQSGELLNHLLTDILTFARHQGNHQLTLDERQFKLRDVGSQIRAIFDNQAKEAAVNLKVEFLGQYDANGRTDTKDKKKYGPPGTGKVKDMRLFGDQQRILQILINLVSNALKFTRGDGFIEVRIRCTTESESPASAVDDSDSLASSKSWKQPPFVSSIKNKSSQRSFPRSNSKTDKDNSRLPLHHNKPRPASVASLNSESQELPPNSQELSFEFEVEDTGPGIPKHLKDSIFEPFVQGDVKLTKNYGGTGLGLSICTQLVKLLNGEIKVDSELGQGTTFTVKLPMKSFGARPESIGNYSSRSVSRVNSISPGITVLDKEAHRKPPDEPDTPSPEQQEPVKSPAFDSRSKPRLLGLSSPFFATNNPPMASPDESGAQIDQGKSRVRVLVAEDNAVNQEVVLRMLRLEDVFDVRVAKDGQEAVDCVKESMESDTPYDLILMDVQVLCSISNFTHLTYDVLHIEFTALLSLRSSQSYMFPSFALQFVYFWLFYIRFFVLDLNGPRLDDSWLWERNDFANFNSSPQMPKVDGRESTRMIREIGYSAPIVALTAFSDEANKKECMDSGMDYFLAKPIKRPALKSVLKRYCPPIHEEEEGQPANVPGTSSHKRKSSRTVQITGDGVSQANKEAPAGEKSVVREQGNQSVDQGPSASAVRTSFTQVRDDARPSGSRDTENDMQGLEETRFGNDRVDFDNNRSKGGLSQVSKILDGEDLSDESPLGTVVRDTPKS
ncbi:MAG: Histidine kinase [Alyxoria varia]|nr:MAG: Histidine kinase [Alyxoria varia]